MIFLSLKEVETFARLFFATIALPPLGARSLAQLVVDVERFSVLCKQGKVAPGRAQLLAAAIVEEGERWLERTPDVLSYRMKFWAHEQVLAAAKFLPPRAPAGPSLAADQKQTMAALRAALAAGWVEESSKEIARDLCAQASDVNEGGSLS